MDPLDKLLAQLARGTQEPDALESSLPSPSPDSSQSLCTVDSLLAQIDQDTKRTVRADLSKHRAIAPTQNKQVIPANQDSSPPPPLPIAPVPDQSNTQRAKPAQARKLRQPQQQSSTDLPQQQNLHARQQRLDELRQTRRAELTEYARVWLNQLEPQSEEGLWFEEFACSYDSRLEAALDYLEALQSVERESRKF